MLFLTVVTKTACQTIMKTISIKVVTYQVKFGFYSGGLLQCQMKCGYLTKVIITIMSYFQKETFNNET